MDNNINYSKIEKLKYKHSRQMLIYSLFILVNLLMANVYIFDGIKKGEDKNLFLFIILNGYLFMQILLLPLLIAIISSKAVEIEERGDMLKVLVSSGINLRQIYDVKLIYILKTFTASQIALWIILIGELYLLGYPCFHMPDRLIIMFISFFAISYLIMLLHYNIAIISGKHLISLSTALLGSLSGFISLFFTKIPLIPYAWYALINSVKYVYISDNHFEKQLIYPEIYPIIASSILLILMYIAGKKMFLRRHYD